MANQPLPNVGIKNSWSFINFAKSHGKPKLASFEKVDEETGEINKWKSVAFESPTEVNPETGLPAVTFVAFSSKLGELTARQIVDMKDELQVVQREGSSSYILCKRGSNSWEDINIDL